MQEPGLFFRAHGALRTQFVQRDARIRHTNSRRFSLLAFVKRWTTGFASGSVQTLRYRLHGCVRLPEKMAQALLRSCQSGHARGSHRATGLWWNDEPGRRTPRLLGDEIVAADEPTRTAHSGDKWFATHQPEAVVFAQTTEQVSRLLRFASENKIPVTARGAGFGYVGGCVPVQGGIALSLARMNRIKEISFADAIAVVEPGVITGELQAAVRAQKLFYPPDPASLHDCSIGGNVATNAGGPRCLKYGVTRHYIIGLEVVLASGEVLRTGGRVHKNKTGFDLIGLFVGSEGLFGVVTEDHRAPPALAAGACHALGRLCRLAQAAAAVQAIFAAGFLPSRSRSRIISPSKPRDAIAAPGSSRRATRTLLVDVDGQPESVRSEVDALRALLES